MGPTALELLDAILALRLLALDDDLRRRLARIRIDNDVRGLGADLGAELDAGLKLDLSGLIAVLVQQLVDPELAHDLLGRRLAALHVDLKLFVAGGERDKALQIILGFTRVHTSGNHLRIDRKDRVNRFAKVSELGQFVAEPGSLKIRSMISLVPKACGSLAIILLSVPL